MLSWYNHNSLFNKPWLKQTMVSLLAILPLYAWRIQYLYNKQWTKLIIDSEEKYKDKMGRYKGAVPSLLFYCKNSRLHLGKSNRFPHFACSNFPFQNLISLPSHLPPDLTHSLVSQKKWISPSNSFNREWVLGILGLAARQWSKLASSEKYVLLQMCLALPTRSPAI